MHDHACINVYLMFYDILQYPSISFNILQLLFYITFDGPECGFSVLKI